jgi:uracil phosphoribosyltransferase
MNMPTLENEENLKVVRSSVVQNSLTRLRDKDTDLAGFRDHGRRVSFLLLAAALEDLEMSNEEIETPLEKMESPVIADKIVLLYIFRAGLAMLEGGMQLLPDATATYVGLRRNEQTAVAEEYYWNVPPEQIDGSVVVICDPMLATGGSLLEALNKLAKMNPKEVRFVCWISAPEGIEAVHQKYPDVKIFTAAVDRELDINKYIRPGLGDAGDRENGT